MTTATSTATVLTALQSAGLVLTLTPDRGLGVTPKARLTEPLRVLIKAHREDLVRWLGRSASNDPTARVDMGIPTSPPAPASTDWQALDKAYQAHHVNCPTCIAAGKGYGLRCGTGAALWAVYDVAEPAHSKVSTRVAQPAPAIHTPSADIHPSLLTAATPDDVNVMAARLALFAGRGVGVDDADRLADKLLVRDRENERVGCCAECIHLRGNAPGRWKCGDNARAVNELSGAWLGAAFVHQHLHHCPSLKATATPATPESKQP